MAIVALVFAAVLASLAALIVIPAPNFPLLPLGVAAPEYAPYLALAGLVTAVVASSLLHDRLGLAIAALGGVGVLFALPVLVGYPSLVTKADAALRRLPHDRGWLVSPYAPFARLGRAGATVDENEPVPLRDGTTLGLDLYRPMTPGLHPAVVVIYGGAWAFGDRTSARPLALVLARAGYAVAMVDYRHVPAVRSPVPLHDVEDALAVLARRAPAWRIDPARIAVLGRSAGAQLALVLASTPQPVRIAAAVGIYAPLDLVGGYEERPKPDPADIRAILRGYLGGPPDAEHLAAYRAASPQTYAAALRAPTLLLTGTSDELVLPKFQRRYAATLERAGTPTVALEVPLANHAFDEVPCGRGAAFERAVLLRFLAATLSSGDMSPPSDGRTPLARPMANSRRSIGRETSRPK